MKKKLPEFIKLIEGKLLTQQNNFTEIEISGGYVSDLLSDVMGNAKEGSVWITIMRHLNIIAVASLTNLSTVVFSKDIIPDQVVITKANEENICLISSPLTSFEIAGILYNFLKIK